MHVIYKALATSLIMLTPAGMAKTGVDRMEARGTFEVTVKPAEATAFERAMGASRYELVKDWNGDFVGTSKGEMLSSLTESSGAMAYVAMEEVTGKLSGKHGSFYFAHRATMTKGEAASGEMHIVVVKGSGTEDLVGLSGDLTIIIDSAGKHSYVFDYELPSK